MALSGPDWESLDSSRPEHVTSSNVWGYGGAG
jgi:hypothetical protein